MRKEGGIKGGQAGQICQCTKNNIDMIAKILLQPFQADQTIQDYVRIHVMPTILISRFRSCTREEFGIRI